MPPDAPDSIPMPAAAAGSTSAAAAPAPAAKPVTPPPAAAPAEEEPKFIFAQTHPQPIKIGRRVVANTGRVTLTKADAVRVNDAFPGALKLLGPVL